MTKVSGLPVTTIELELEDDVCQPERALALAVLHRALLDLWNDSGLVHNTTPSVCNMMAIKRDARTFMASRDCAWWAQMAGVDVAQIRALARLRPAARFIVRRDNRD